MNIHLTCKQIRDNYWTLSQDDVVLARIMYMREKFYSYTQNCFVTTTDTFEEAIASLQKYELYYYEEGEDTTV